MAQKAPEAFDDWGSCGGTYPSQTAEKSFFLVEIPKSSRGRKSMCDLPVSQSVVISVFSP
jgi:hypothetical protein